uniref:Sensor histidine kinase n=1 Tax=Desertifilum tharense IPPAS B-1220 TaxID=1781255 RepID=A0ACD5GUU3_9CYAN
MRQITVKLLHNAIKFTPPGGQVQAIAKQHGDFVEIEFQDTGIGIPRHELPHIFDRFYRVRSSASESGEDLSPELSTGTGLGLAIVRQLLLCCGGSITVNSQVGKGSVFKVLLPIYR